MKIQIRHPILLVCAAALSCAASIAPVWATTPGESPASGSRWAVASGCEAPVISEQHAYFVDPVRGSVSGDGSRAHPWRRLQEVLATDTPRIHGGDIIYLASGDHGAVVATADNTVFVEVTAEPGQHPVLRSLEITGARWLFSGLKIQSLRADGRVSALVSIHTGPKAANNIVLDGNEIAPTEDVSNWSSIDWLKNGMTGLKVEGGEDGTTCIAITRNTIKATGGAANVGGGSALLIYADHSLVAGNTIDHFADDAIDFGANDLVISGNKITNNVGVEDGNHNDAIQGFVPGGQRYKSVHAYHNILIDSNLIIRQTDPDLRQPVALQGIDNFGGAPTDWYDVKITNNVVITNTYHGITFGALHRGMIARNTVLADGLATSQRQLLGGGKEGRAATPGNQVWIMVTDQINHLPTPGGPSSEVVVEDNISALLQILAQGAHARRNLALDGIALNAGGGKPGFFRVAGEYGDHNTLDPTAIGEFKAWHPASYRFDLSRRTGKLAGRGSALLGVDRP